MENFMEYRARLSASDDTILGQIPKSTCQNICQRIFKCYCCEESAAANTIGYCDTHFLERYRAGLQRIPTQEEVTTFLLNSAKPRCKDTDCNSFAVDIGFCASHFSSQYRKNRAQTIQRLHSAIMQDFVQEHAPPPQIIKQCPGPSCQRIGLDAYNGLCMPCYAVLYQHNELTG